MSQHATKSHETQAPPPTTKKKARVGSAPAANNGRDGRVAFQIAGGLEIQGALLRLTAASPSCSVTRRGAGPR